MSSKAEWRIVSPAPKSAGLALAGARARVRRGVLAQLRNVESTAIYRGDEPMAVAMFGRHGWRRTEMALAISPAAAGRMRRLVRMAQLTMARLAETHLIVISVHPANGAGQRMAMLTGFKRARLANPYLWVFRSEKHESLGRRQQRKKGGRGKPPRPDDRQRPPDGGAE